MKKPFQSRAFASKRTVYDHAAIVEMAKTMSGAEIIAKTGISASHLRQVLAAAGVKNRPSPQSQAKAEESSSEG